MQTGRHAGIAALHGAALHGAAADPNRPVLDRPFGRDAVQILATEHWSLLATRSMIWNEALSRTTVFLTVLSAAVVSLALTADAAGSGPRTASLALALLPVVLFLGIATYTRLVQINDEDLAIVLAMNRLRRGYLIVAPGLEPYFSTGHHDDEHGVATTYLLGSSRDLRSWVHCVVTSTTVVATVDAAIATAITVLLAHTLGAPTVIALACGAPAFLAVWGVLFSRQRRTLTLLRRTEPRFPS